MSRYDYEISKDIDYPFYALIMAAMRKADSFNLTKLKTVCPKIWEELQARYDAPGGILPGEK